MFQRSSFVRKPEYKSIKIEQLKPSGLPDLAEESVVIPDNSAENDIGFSFATLAKEEDEG